MNNEFSQSQQDAADEMWAPIAAAHAAEGKTAPHGLLEGVYATFKRLPSRAWGVRLTERLAFALDQVRLDDVVDVEVEKRNGNRKRMRVKVVERRFIETRQTEADDRGHAPVLICTIEKEI